MRNLIGLVLIMMALMACSENPTSSDVEINPTDTSGTDTTGVDTTGTDSTEFIVPSLELQNIDIALAKDLIKRYPTGVPYSEIETAVLLAKASEGNDISFGNVNSTKEFFYILVNNGSSDIRDVHFESEMVVVEPGYIPMVESEGFGLGIIPIVKIAVPHLVPLDGTGAMLAFEIGAFTDTIHTTYEYNSLQGDTVSAFKDWDVTGTKLGAKFDVTVGGLSLLGDLLVDKSWRLNQVQGGDLFQTYSRPVNDLKQDTMLVVNDGNVPLTVKVYPYYAEESINYGEIATLDIPVGNSVIMNDYFDTMDTTSSNPNDWGVQVKLFNVFSLTSALSIDDHTLMGGSIQMLMYYDQYRE